MILNIKYINIPYLAKNAHIFNQTHPYMWQLRKDRSKTGQDIFTWRALPGSQDTYKDRAEDIENIINIHWAESIENNIDKICIFIKPIFL